MKLTDAQVAKVLHFQECGWKLGKRARCRSKKGHCDIPVDRYHSRKLPSFTTSLDLIVAEIEVRGLWYELTGWNGAKPPLYLAVINARGKGCSDLSGAKFDIGPTAPLALCAALLAYLKVTP